MNISPSTKRTCTGILHVLQDHPQGDPAFEEFLGHTLQQFADTAREPSWIRSAVRLPDTDRTVVVFVPDAEEEICTAYWNGGRWRQIFSGSLAAGDAVTHWLELPEPPDSDSE